MWLLIEVKDHNDVGKNELRRILLSPRSVEITEPVPCQKTIRAHGCEVHPNTLNTDGQFIPINQQTINETHVKKISKAQRAKRTTNRITFRME